jgi:hypothetical protein
LSWKFIMHSLHVTVASMIMLIASIAANAGRACGSTTWRHVTSLNLEEARAWVAAEGAPRDFTVDGMWYDLNSVTALSVEAAETLAKARRPLSLNGLTALSPAVAAALAKHEPIAIFGAGDLRLNGLKALSPQAAEALAAHQGMVLLHGLEKLDSVPLAQKLARQWGELRLGLTELSPRIAAELAKHRGADKTEGKKPFKAAANPFGRQDRAASILRLDNLESLSPETAEALAAHEGVLVLNGLTSVDAAVATALAKRIGNSRRPDRPATGALVLNGLPSISTDAAAALAAFPGEIVLKAITKLSPETAVALAKHKGRLHLTGLTVVSPEIRAALCAHEDVLLPTHAQSLEEW